MKVIENFLWFWIARAMRKNFFSIHMRGAEALRHLPGGTVICANHSGWWDTFTCVFLKRTFALPAYGMMEDKNLRTASFLRHVGVYGIDLSSPRSAAGGLRRTLDLLAGGAVIFLFPQGRHVPFGVCPVEFKPGLEWVLRKSPDTRVCCLAVRYEHLWESRPQIFLNAALLPAGSTAEDARTRLETLMGQIDQDIQTQDFSTYETLMESGLSINKRWERFVCLLTGKPFTPKNT